MARPKRATESDPKFRSEDILHSEHTFARPLPSLQVIEEFISRGKHSGKLEIDFSKGGKTNCRFFQKQPVEIIP